MKKLFIGLAILVLVTIPAAFLHMAQGVFLHDHFLYRIDPDTYSTYNTNIHMDHSQPPIQFSGRVFNGSFSATLQILDGSHPNVFPLKSVDEVVLFHIAGQDFVLGCRDGKLFNEDGSTFSVRGVLPAELTLETEMGQKLLLQTMWDIYQGRVFRQGELLSVIVGLLLSVIGLNSMVFPHKFNFRSWQYRDGTLTDSALLLRQICGVFLGVFGIAFMYLSLFIR